ncbi:hypothetical protein I552_7457 [Mycobacterium xenopi 3993]|nr:hypothetical protein I552_7457 [Mycobacterium xenopi 3993]
MNLLFNPIDTLSKLSLGRVAAASSVGNGREINAQGAAFPDEESIS